MYCLSLIFNRLKIDSRCIVLHSLQLFLPHSLIFHQCLNILPLNSDSLSFSEINLLILLFDCLQLCVFIQEMWSWLMLKLQMVGLAAKGRGASLLAA